MQAIILAGGFGSRLGELTKSMPKAMMNINGKPFIHHQLELLWKNGIKDVIISTGYMGNKIQDYLNYSKNAYPSDMNILFSQEDTPLGTGGALRLIKDRNIKLNDQFFIINGDTYLDIDYKKIFNEFRQFLIYFIAKAIIIGHNTDKNNMLVRRGKVIDYDKYNVCKNNITDAGVLLVKKEVIDYIEPGKKVSFEENIYPILIDKEKLLAIYSAKPFYDIGTIENLQQFRFMKK